MRSLAGAGAFCAVRSYLATATRHGTGWTGALTQALDGNPWIPGHRPSQPATARPAGPGAGLRPAATAKPPGVARTGALP
jgi:hypothetical protein